MPDTRWIERTGNQDVDGVLGDWGWDAPRLTYSFPARSSHYELGYGEGENLNGFGALNAQQQAVARAVFRMVESFTNLDFVEIVETAGRHADLRLAQSDDGSTAWGYLPSPAPEGGDSWYNNRSGIYDGPVRGNYAFTTFIHEIGHTLGLKHGHVDRPMTAAHDSMEYSVMTYRSHVGDAPTGYGNEEWGFAQTWMMADIAALQHMYGADYTANAGNTVYRWNSLTGAMVVDGLNGAAPGGNRIFMTVWDGGGVDTYDFSNYATNLTVDLRPGGWTTTAAAQLADLGDGFRARGNIANALLFEGDTRSLIENAIGGTGNDAITGNEAANALRGGGGDDLLNGGAGRDVLNGGRGLDSFRFDAALGDGFDRIVGWSAAEDTILLSRAVFAALAPGALAAGAFQLGSEALQLDDRILYDGRTGVLRYDADGSGTRFEAEAFATVANRGALTAADFTVVSAGRQPAAAAATDDYADRINDRSAPFGSFAGGGPRTGTVEVGGDWDLFAIGLTAGRTYTFNLRGVDSGGGSLGDPYLHLLNRGGGVLVVDDDGGLGKDSQITFTATYTGRHYLVARAFGSFPTGDYTIQGSVVRSAAAAPEQLAVADPLGALGATEASATVGTVGATVPTPDEWLRPDNGF